MIASRFLRRLAAAPFALVVVTASALARADKVAVLPFTAGGSGSPGAQVEEAREATRQAVLALHDALPSPSEMVTAQVAVRDGVADTSAEMQAAGRASSSQWTVVGHVESHGATYRLEIEACQVSSGRVESVAREVDGRQATPQIAEMLQLLLRPQGIGDTAPPWDHPPLQAPAPAPPPPSAPPPSAPPVANAPPAAPQDDPFAAAAQRPVSIGLGAMVLAAAQRPDNARGARTAGFATASLAWDLAAVRGLSLRGDLAAGLVGPQSIALDAGARFVVPIVASARVFAGPELGIGAFFPLGGDRSARLLLHAALPFTWQASDQVGVEALPVLDDAPGGSGALLLVGGAARVTYRF